MNKIVEIIIQEKPISDILNELFLFKKVQTPSFSLESMKRKCKIPNKSNLHEMLHGKRKVPKKYRESILLSLNISGICKSFFLKKIEYEYKKNDELREEVRLLKQALQIKLIDESLAVSLDAFKVFCSFGLCQSKPIRISDLSSILIGWAKTEITKCLDELVNATVIEITNNNIEIKNTHVIFASEGPQQVSIGPTLIKHFLSQSLDLIDETYNYEDTFFSSSIISVKKDTYLKEIEIFKEHLSKFRITTESLEADELISINVQAYPIALKK